LTATGRPKWLLHHLQTFYYAPKSVQKAGLKTKTNFCTAKQKSVQKVLQQSVTIKCAKKPLKKLSARKI
jgi:hypothetical protein